MKCPRCGEDNDPEARFCASCGQPLTEASISLPEEEPPGRDERTIPHRDLGELLNETFVVYQRNFWPFVLMFFLANIPSIIAAFTPGVVSVSFIVLSVALSVLAGGATVYGVTQQYLGRPVIIEECFRRAWGRGLYLIVAAVLFGIILFGAVLLSLLLIGIPILFYLLVSLFFYSQVVMLEGRGPIDALGRSWELVRGSWWRTFGIVIVFMLIVIAVTLVAAIPGTILSLINTSLGSILVSVFGVVAPPIIYIGATHVYIDLRVRKEGYDLERMASEVGRA